MKEEIIKFLKEIIKEDYEYNLRLFSRDLDKEIYIGGKENIKELLEILTKN